MRNSSFFAVTVTILAMLWLGGCGAPANTPTESGTGSSAQRSAAGSAVSSCRIDGKSWEATDASSYAEIGVNEKGERSLSIKLINGIEAGRHDKISFLFKNNATRSEVILTGGECQFSTTDPKDTTYFCKSGRLLITRIDDAHVEGTFNFKAVMFDDRQMVSATDGKFNVKIRK